MARHPGTEAFKRALAKVPAAVRREVDGANAKSAAEWVAAAKAAAPTDPEDGTPLKDSIRHERTPEGGQVIRAGGPTTTKPVLNGQDGTYDYALAQEFGTVDMPANPFFWPTYRLLRKRFDARRRRALNKAMKAFRDG